MTVITIQTADAIQQAYIINRLREVGMMWEEIELAQSQFAVALSGTRICGFVGLEFDGAYALLRSLYVEPEVRQHGIAAQLLAWVDQVAQTRQLNAVFCFSTGAGQYFIKQGYAHASVAGAVQHVRNAPQARYYLARGNELAEEISYSKWSVPRPHTGLCLRNATLADLPAITAIYTESVAHDTASWEYEPPNLHEMQSRMQKVVDAGYPYIVAEIDGEVAGYSYASSYRPRIGYRFVCEDSVYVDKLQHGRGIGKALLGNLIQRCAAQGLMQMVAVIGDSENHASIGLHNSLGFTQVALLPKIGYKFNRWLDSVMMQRDLTV